MGFFPVKKGSRREGFSEELGEGGFQKVPRTPPRRERPLRRAPCFGVPGLVWRPRETPFGLCQLFGLGSPTGGSKDCNLSFFTCFFPAGRIHQFFWPKFAKQTPELITSRDVLQPLRQALLALRDAAISSQICSSKLQRVFTLGDGCWLPIIFPEKAKKMCQKTTSSALSAPEKRVSGN